MNKIFKALALAGALALACTGAACGGSQKSGAPEVVCTIFPQYDWTSNLAKGSEIGLTLIQDSGVDMHNYQATAADKIKILGCDMLVYVGGESDGWVEDILADPAKNPDMKVVKLLDEVDALDEEEVPGADHDHEEEEEGVDEHVWLSLKNAQTLCRAIAGALKKVDPDRAELYDGNLNGYLGALGALEAQYAEATKAPARKIMLFGDRFPFRYLAEDYGLSYFAAFSGCSAETEASFETIKNLVEAVDQYDLPYILVLEGSDKKIANQIVSQSQKKNQTILSLNSLQSVTRKEIEGGTTYLSLMEENLRTLTVALN